MPSKKTAKKESVTEIPSLEHVLSTMAYHMSSLMTDRSHDDRPSITFACGLGGYAKDCPNVLIQGTIEAAPTKDPWGGWAQVTLDGKICGNRSGGREELVRRYAPVIAWVAAYWAAKASAAA